MPISNPFHVSLAQNQRGRDIVIGDLHGMFDELAQLLSSIDFNPESDRVICCGDLIDRGNQSEACLRLMDEPWFYSVMGNHELFIQDCHLNQESIKVAIENGAYWYFMLDPEDMAEVRNRAKQLPVTLDFRSGDKLVGVVHADIPDGLSWQDLKSLQPSLDRDKLVYALTCSRRLSVKNLKRNRSVLRVAGVDTVYHGHNIHQSVRRLENRILIDTGAFKGYYPHQLSGHIWSNGSCTAVGSRTGLAC